ncbi:PREDICTED: uncharacterized protein LOC104815122 [Tarenaya hassleriana]|uniref:uncharacterized protein LOC104815122 n=1 Tax=Tarenaya hassleriana TaxID=28532 RepID=UPI00053C4E8F|nr:PREDICTED: uncharacterized protein LOC104815122 [Tarenaya hassleriana]
MSTATYDQLVAHWDSEEGTEKSQIFSSNRRSRAEIERAPPTHTAGRRSFARVAHEIEIEDAIQAKITDRLSQLEESCGSTQLSPAEINSLYLEVVQPDAKGRIYNVGGMATQLGGGHPDAASIGRHIALTKEVEALKKKIEEFEEDRRKIARLEEGEARIARYETLFARLFPPHDDPPTTQEMQHNPFLTPQSRNSLHVATSISVAKWNISCSEENENGESFPVLVKVILSEREGFYSG